ncbi:hypothetical protein B566_EDAN010257 [Ephemera danica]|nr:hypothetical protein B566_EDAN010257 [Ephemera danica]
MDWANESLYYNTSLESLPGNETGNTARPEVPASSDGACFVEPPVESTVLGLDLAVPAWEAIFTALTLTAIIMLTVVGNVLVILSVFTHKPLRIVQNFFIVSLAVADLTVAVLVLPLNVAYSLVRRWLFGIHVCKLWLTYWAITDPINYAQKRTVRRVLLMIAGVWLVSLIISSPPLAGWNDWPEEFDRDTPCQLTTQQGYVIYSSLGSFYIPLFIMTLVYVEIFIATKRRLRERAKASRLNVTPAAPAVTTTPDGESVSSEASEGRVKRKKRRKKGSVERKRQESLGIREDSVTDIGNHCQDTGMTTVGNSPDLRSCHHEDTVNGTTNNSAGHVLCPLDPGKNLLPHSTSMDNAFLKPPDLAAPAFTLTKSTVAPEKKSSVYQFIEERQRISLSKERRAARTLGIIMGYKS